MLKYISNCFHLIKKRLMGKGVIVSLLRFCHPAKNHKIFMDGFIAKNKYGGYFVPFTIQHRYAAKKILKGEVYEPDTINFITKNYKYGDIIHAGTFFGDFLPSLSHSLSKNSKLWAFEPNPENFRSAQITCIINNLKNVKLNSYALGAEKSQSIMQIKLGKDFLGGSSRIVSKRRKGETIPIEIIPIDDIIPKDRLVSIIQLDIEGYEKEALIGGLKTINRCKPIIIVEDNNNVIQSNWFAENLLSIGYEVNQKIHNNTLLSIPNLHTNIVT